jgi:anaerobic selenocysteine-containing dehydrogenase
VKALTLPFERMPTLDNPVQTSISMFMWTDAIERGPEMTALRDGVRGKDKLDVPIKMIWNYAGNCLINQHSEINRTHEILQDDKKCEMIVVIDCHMTSSAKYADILLPDCTASEQMDFALDASCGNMSYVIFADQAIKPRFECKTIYEMTTSWRNVWALSSSLPKAVQEGGCAICMSSPVKRSRPAGFRYLPQAGHLQTARSGRAPRGLQSVP